MSEDRIVDTLARELYTLEDEDNPRGSDVNLIWPETILDQVIDNEDPGKKTLRQILADIHEDILTGGKGNIVFPVTSVNGMTDDVIIKPENIGLGRVDNTSDIDKPMSGPQRKAVLEILDNYNFTVNLSDLYSHIRDFSNPHHVTLDQLNSGGEINKIIAPLISSHNTSTESNIHPDIRKNIRRLALYAEEINTNLSGDIMRLQHDIVEHLNASDAHINALNKKENLSNKVKSFSKTANNDYDKYPSTRAVVEFVTEKMKELNDAITESRNCIADIRVIDNISLLPAAVSKYHGTVFFIRNGEGSKNKIAVCRKNPGNTTYSWDIFDIGTISKFNPEQFEDTVDGLSIKMDSIIFELINGEIDNAVNTTMENYYTRDQIDDLHFIRDIKILPGSMNGTIKFYINDDMTTMSDDIPVAGLKRLAYLEWVTENELADQAVHERHILSDSIARRHIKFKSVNANRMACSNGKLLGNIDYDDDTAHEIDVKDLVKYIRNIPGLNLGSGSGSGSLPFHRWKDDAEYDLGDGSYGRRFRGTCSALPNFLLKLEISDLIHLSRYRLIDAGGVWKYQSDPEEWTMLGGSNITGHTFATITMDSKALYFESISIGNRFEAEYDIWIRYIKTSEELEYIEPVYENTCSDKCDTIEDDVIISIYNGTYDGPMDDDSPGTANCGPMTEETVRQIWETGEIGDDEDAGDACEDIPIDDVQSMFNFEPAERTCPDNCSVIDNDVITAIYNGTYEGSLEDDTSGSANCGPMTEETVRQIWNTGEIGDDDNASEDCKDIPSQEIRDMFK